MDNIDTDYDCKTENTPSEVQKTENTTSEVQSTEIKTVRRGSVRLSDIGNDWANSKGNGRFVKALVKVKRKDKHKYQKKRSSSVNSDNEEKKGEIKSK